VVNGSVVWGTDYIGRSLSQTWSMPTLQASIEAAAGQSRACKNFLGLNNNGASYSASRPVIVLSVARNF
jgi:hypothetical protein